MLQTPIVLNVLQNVKLAIKHNSVSLVSLASILTTRLLIVTLVKKNYIYLFINKKDRKILKREKKENKNNIIIIFTNF
jgi:hypothetical protein